MFAPHVWDVGTRGDSIATFGSLAGCCAQVHVVIARLRTENTATAIATLPMNVRRSITRSPPRLVEVQLCYASRRNWTPPASVPVVAVQRRSSLNASG